ncbi:hypothetical protein D3C72_1990300 [compost metagenome]
MAASQAEEPGASGPDWAASKRCEEPTLLVRITRAFLKSTVRPWLSVRRPSSRI